MDNTELRNKLKDMLLNTKELAQMLDVNYFDLVRFLSGKTTNLSKPQLEKVQKYFSNKKTTTIETPYD